ncbi:MAG TPA: SDR family oxidoreductase [Trebonia sp.]|jgi:NAD(P)-dependent dehydrogenase (short-subunit alcohol dehydrogenase family)|nr:SDR family oxidoreductase [Trebonia sp.]
MRALEGKVAIVTGAGNGIGRSEALCLARAGAAVVVNDLGGAATGPGQGGQGQGGQGPADTVVAEIVAAGGRAAASYADVSDWKASAGLAEQALDEFGRLDIVVTNAGIVRRAAITEVTERDLDTQMAVLFKGTYALVHHVAAYWKGLHEGGDHAHRTMVLTSSSGGVPGGVREFSVYGSMKAGVAALALGAALEFRAFGVTVNAILPHAASRMDSLAKGLPDHQQFEPGSMDPMNPEHVGNVVAYLACPAATWLSGQVFEVTGTNVRRWVPWSPAAEADSAQQWTPEALDAAMATVVYGTLPAGRVIPNRR